MATIKLVSGVTTQWTTIMSTELNSLANGNAILGSTTVDNSANNDLMAEFSLVGGSITTTGSPFLGLYLFPQNGDNSTYGDGRFAAASAGPPSSNYYVGYMGMSATTSTIKGAFGIPFGSNFIKIPHGVWKPVLYNSLGTTFTSSGNVLYYRTTNLSVT